MIHTNEATGFYGNFFSTFYLNAAGEVWQLYDADWSDAQIGIPVRASHIPADMKRITNDSTLAILRVDFISDAFLIGLA